MPIRRPPVTTTPLADEPNDDPRDSASPRRGGRPSRGEAERLGKKILDVATAMFLTGGYGATSIETIARRARISKRTFYHRFPDKAALFGAVVRKIVERLRPPNDAALFTGGTLDEILLGLARVIMNAALKPEALGLYRVIVAEAGRFPELAATVAGQGARQEGIVRIAALLQHEAEGITMAAARFAAAQFMFMVVAVPQRRALGMGVPMADDELDAWAQDTVKLFLNGFRSQARPSS
jgi:TetR/AcrR family transcriptional repressor of mexJK operon